MKRINLAVSNISQILCARTSLLSGIASGVGIGFIRGITASKLEFIVGYVYSIDVHVPLRTMDRNQLGNGVIRIHHYWDMVNHYLGFMIR